jgi:hypothetical protein
MFKSRCLNFVIKRSWFRGVCDAVYLEDLAAHLDKHLFARFSSSVLVEKVVVLAGVGVSEK